jgi:hypothetical protein
MIENPTEEIIFMNVMTLLCEYTGLRADKHYSIETDSDVPPMTLNENYTYFSKLVEKIFRKEYLIINLIKEIEKILNIKIKYENNTDELEWTDIKNLETLMQYINGYIN